MQSLANRLLKCHRFFLIIPYREKKYPASLLSAFHASASGLDRGHSHCTHFATGETLRLYQDTELWLCHGHVLWQNMKKSYWTELIHQLETTDQNWHTFFFNFWFLGGFF